MAVAHRATLWRFTSLDSILEHRDRSADEKRTPTVSSDRSPSTVSITEFLKLDSEALDPERYTSGGRLRQKTFRCTLAEIGFCFSMAMTQFLTEYLISGFGVLLPSVTKDIETPAISAFWPASVLSIVVSSMTLPFARAADMYGGYPFFVLGLAWLTVWTLLAGCAQTEALLNVSRAMQGLAIASFQPASFTLIGAVYPPGCKRNLVFGVYGACAPLGFYFGIFVSGLSVQYLGWQWYFWIASILSFLAVLSAFLSVPVDPSNRQKLDLSMDWLGTLTIASGLILVAYALAASSSADYGWSSVTVIAPLAAGVVCLCLALLVEMKVSQSPLLPRDFFRVTGVRPFLLACVLFYGSFGTFLFYSISYCQTVLHASPLQLVAWYAPMAIGGIIISVIGGSICHVIPITGLLLLSGLAWVGAPLLFALAPQDASYWAWIMPSMICCTLGVDLTYTISSIFLTSVQPLRYQGLAGAICSVVVNLGIAFSLSLAGIISFSTPSKSDSVQSMKGVFWFAVGLAGLGFLICLLYVRISRVDGGHAQPKATSPLEPSSPITLNSVESK